MLPTSLNQINQTPNHSPANARQRNTPLAALPKRPGLALLMVFVLLALAAASLRAAIPAAAKADPRFGLGYLVVTYYPGVTTNGTGDCTAGIQAAINDAFANNAAFAICPFGNSPPTSIPPSDHWRCSSRQAPIRFPIPCSATNGGPTMMPTGAVSIRWSAPRRGLTPLNQAGGRGGPIPKQLRAAPDDCLRRRLQQPGGQNPPVTVTNPMFAPGGYIDAPG